MSEEFAELLTRGIYAIRNFERGSIRVIQDELGIALGKTGGSMVEHWRKGKDVPVHHSDTATLAYEIVRRGKMKRPWLESFLIAGDYPWPEMICEALFPSENKPPPQPSGVGPLKLARKTYQLDLPTDPMPPPAPLPKGSLAPWSKNPLFVGRQSDLLALASSFQAAQTISISQVKTTVSTGLGGIGKTQLASEFVHRYGRFFEGGVYWLSFENPEAVPAEVASCGEAGAMELRPDFGSRSLNEKVKLVTAAWQEPIPRLLVFDNCEDPELLAKWRPSTGGCRVLVTSRRGEWEEVLDVKTIAIGVLARSESVELLAKHCPHIDLGLLDEIAEELGDLPLALHLAGRYLRHYKRSLDPVAYLAQLRDPLLLRHPSMQEGGFSPTGHVQHVGRTFALSYDQLDKADEIDRWAHKLLVHAAHFAPGEPIWYDLLIQTVTEGDQQPGTARRANDAFKRLIDLGLIETEGRDILRMHRLVAKFVRDVAKDQVEATQMRVEEIVADEIKQMNKAVRPLPLLAWQAHLRSVADIAQAREDVESVRLCRELGTHLWMIGDFKGALVYQKKALEICRVLLGPDSADMADCLVSVGRVLRELGRDAEALEQFDRSLAIREGLFGRFDVATAESYENIGRCWHRLGDPAKGLGFIQTALTIVTSVEGDENALAAEYLNNIAFCLYDLKELTQALRSFQKALAINEAVLGGDHVHTAVNLHNIGAVLGKLGRHRESLPYLERGLSLRQAAFGEGHKDVAISLNALAGAYEGLGELDKAAELAFSALSIIELSLGMDHVLVANTGLVLGRILRQQEDLIHAVRYLRRALAIRSAVSGPDHYLTQEIEAELLLLSTQRNG